MVSLAIWNNNYISVQITLPYKACQCRGGGWSEGMPPWKFLKIRPCKGESESVLAIFQWKMMEFQFTSLNFTFPLNQD